MSDPIRKIKLAYKNMLDRCYNENHQAYSNYGERGITVCPEWIHNRDSFIQWAIKNGHDMNLSLDRIDNDKGYYPENCRWVDVRTQLLNQRRAHLLTHNGITQNLSLWAEQIGLPFDTLWRRVSRNLPVEQILKSKRVNEWQHGSRRGYEVYKCRCDTCRDAHNARHRTIRAKRKLS